MDEANKLEVETRMHYYCIDPGAFVSSVTIVVTYCTLQDIHELP